MNPRLLLPALGLLLASCSVLSPTEDPTRHYLLKGVRTTRLSNNPELVVLVGPVTIPGYLEHKQITTSRGHNNLDLAEFHVWAEDLDRAVSRVVAENLSHLLGSPGITPYPAADPPDHDFRCAIIVRRFEKDADGQVHLEASYILSGPSGSDLPLQTASRTITARIGDPGNHASIADAMSRALSDLSRSLARSVTNRNHRRHQKPVSPDPVDE